MDAQLCDKFWLQAQDEACHRGATIRCAAFIPAADGQGVVATADSKDRLYLWSLPVDATQSLFTQSPVSVTLRLNRDPKQQKGIYALCTVPGECAIVAGGGTNLVYWVDVTTGEVAHSVRTCHTAIVNSLCILPKYGTSEDRAKTFFILSGSWDASARIYKVTVRSRDSPNRFDSNVVGELRGEFSYAVTLRLHPCPPALVVGGSQNGIVQFWSWESFETPIKTVRAHTDIVRAFALTADGCTVYSASNDGTICMFKVNRPVDGDRASGKPLAVTLDCVRHVHEAFIFDITLFAKRYLLSACEDGTAGVFSSADLSHLNAMQLSSSVWVILPLSETSLLTGEDRGVLSTWTNRAADVADPELDAAHKETVANARTKQRNQGEAIDVSRLPNIADIHRHSGKRSGQHALFREGNEAIAFTWDGTSWVRVGSVVGTGGSPTPQLTALPGQPDVRPNSNSVKAYHGDDMFPAGHYDYIFEVEVNDDPQRKPLPFRVGDNTFEAAEKFCARENASRTYVPIIAEFLSKNVDQQPRYLSNPPQKIMSQSARASVAQMRSTLLTDCNPILFATWKISVLQEKLLEGNVNAAPEQSDRDNAPVTAGDRVVEDAVHESIRAQEAEAAASGRRLSTVALGRLNAAIDKLKDPDRLQHAEFEPDELNVIFGEPGVSTSTSIAAYAPKYYLPVVDLWRIVALHHQIGAIFKGPAKHGMHILKLAAVAGVAIVDKTAGYDENCSLVALRFFANLHTNPIAATKCILFSPHYLPPIPDIIKRVRGTAREGLYYKAIIALLFNSALSIARQALAVSGLMCELFFKTTGCVAGCTTLDKCNRRLLAVALFLIVSAPQLQPLLKETKVSAVLQTSIHAVVRLPELEKEEPELCRTLTERAAVLAANTVAS